MTDLRQSVAKFRDLLRDSGVRPALEYLNGLGSHRFTAVFRFEGGTLRNLHLIDRDDRTVERCPDQPVLDSYCLYVRDAARQFMTQHAREDPRVEGHPKQQVVQSYCGFPLQASDGSLMGTICHFDYQPVPFDEKEIDLLERVSPMLVEAIVRTEWKPALSQPA